MAGAIADVSATLIDLGTNLPLVGKTITFTLDALPPVSAITDANGVAATTLPIPGAMLAGIYPMTARFAGDAGYFPSSDKVDFEVFTCVEGVAVRVTPETFNVQLAGNWVTGHVDILPAPYTYADIVGGAIVSIGGIPTSIAGTAQGDGVLKFSAAEFSAVAGMIVGPGGARAVDVPVCVVVAFSDGMMSCECCDLIDIINEGKKK